MMECFFPLYTHYRCKLDLNRLYFLNDVLDGVLYCKNKKIPV